MYLQQKEFSCLENVTQSAGFALPNTAIPEIGFYKNNVGYSDETTAEM